MHRVPVSSRDTTLVANQGSHLDRATFGVSRSHCQFGILISGCCRDLPPQGDGLTAGGLCGGGSKESFPTPKYLAPGWGTVVVSIPSPYGYPVRKSLGYTACTKYSYEYVYGCMVRIPLLCASYYYQQTARVFHQRPHGPKLMINGGCPNPLSKASLFLPMLEDSTTRTPHAGQAGLAVTPKPSIRPRSKQSTASSYHRMFAAREAIIRVDNFVAHCPPSRKIPRELLKETYPLPWRYMSPNQRASCRPGPRRGHAGAVPTSP